MNPALKNIEAALTEHFGWSANAALREKINIQMSTPEMAEYQGELEKLRAGISESKLLSNWAAGRGMSLEEAVHFAID